MHAVFAQQVAASVVLHAAASSLLQAGFRQLCMCVVSDWCGGWLPVQDLAVVCFVGGEQRCVGMHESLCLQESSVRALERIRLGCVFKGARAMGWDDC